MIGTKNGAAIRDLQEQVATLGTQLAALSAQLGTVLEAVASGSARQGQLESNLTELAASLSAQAEAAQHQSGQLAKLREEELDTLRRDLTGQAERSGEQLEQLRRDMEDRFSRVREDGERREERLNQLRGDLARAERQAAIDLDQMARTNQALVEALLLARGRRAEMPDVPDQPQS